MANRNPNRLGPSDATGRRSILNSIHEDMIVYDINEERIGLVDFVHFGAASEVDQNLGRGAASPGPADSSQMRDDTFVDMIADAFDGQDVPRELRRKLLQEGYVRMDADGLFAADRFIVPDQIDSVREHDLHLNVARDQLIKRV